MVFGVSNAKYLTFNTSNSNAVSHLSARGFTPTRLQQRSKLPRGDNWNHMSVYVVDPTSNGGLGTLESATSLEQC